MNLPKIINNPLTHSHTQTIFLIEEWNVLVFVLLRECFFGCYFAIAVGFFSSNLLCPASCCFFNEMKKKKPHQQQQQQQQLPLCNSAKRIPFYFNFCFFFYRRHLAIHTVETRTQNFKREIGYDKFVQQASERKRERQNEHFEKWF